MALAGMVAVAAPAQAACSSNNVVVIAMHGTNESQYGRLWSTVNAIEAKTAYNATGKFITYNSAININSLNYPAALEDGENKLMSYIETSYKSCSSTKYVLLGYSMGAHVVGNMLDPYGDQLSSGMKGQIKAVVLYGDPSFVANRPYDKGTYASYTNGRLARAYDELNSWSSKLASWCDKDDLWCQPGFSESVHTGYFSKYDSAAASFVKGKLGK